MNHHDEYFGEFPEEEYVGGYMPNYRFQEAYTSDLSKLLRLENKCYDYPLDQESWKQILNTAPANNPLPNDMHSYKCMTYRIDSTIVGFYVYKNLPSEEPHLELLRIGVHPDYRQKGYGTMLVDNAKQKAASLGLQEVEIVIPEYWLDPEEKRGVVSFVDTTGMAPVDYLRDAFHHYGKLYDGIRYRTGARRRTEFASV